MNKPKLVTNIPMRRGIGRTGLRRNGPCTNPLLKVYLFSQSSQIQRPTLLSQKPPIPSTQRVIHPTYVQKINNTTTEPYTNGTTQVRNKI